MPAIERLEENTTEQIAGDQVLVLLGAGSAQELPADQPSLAIPFDAQTAHDTSVLAETGPVLTDSRRGPAFAQRALLRQPDEGHGLHLVIEQYAIVAARKRNPSHP